MATRIVLKENEIKELLRSRNGEVAKYLFAQGKKVEGRAKRLAPVDTGRLRSSISTELTETDGAPAARVGTAVNYARFVHDGTGIFGPSGRMIRPVRAKRLVFRPKGAKKTVFAKAVKGQRGTEFLTEALKVLR